MFRLEQLRLDVIRAGFWLRPWWKVTRDSGTPGGNVTGLHSIAMVGIRDMPKSAYCRASI